MKFRRLADFRSVLVMLCVFLVIAVACSRDKTNEPYGGAMAPSMAADASTPLPTTMNEVPVNPIPPATVPLLPPIGPRMALVVDDTAATLTPELLEATLEPGESTVESKMLHLPMDVVPAKGDVVFVIDLTGSMYDELSNVMANSVNIMNSIRALIPDTQFGVISHMDYPGEFSGCGYSNPYGNASAGDYAYSLDQALTGDMSAVQTAIMGLTLGDGQDGPEDYTRVLYESYSDAGVGWRTGSTRFVVQWGDNVPHDCDVFGCLGGTETTGPDPGRNAIANDGDDLEILPVLDGMAANNILLLALHSGSWFSLWDCYASRTGGEAFQINSDGTIPGGSDIATLIANLIGEQIREISHLTLEVCTPGYEDWLVNVNPAQYDSVSLDTAQDLPFEITIQVPDDTEDGEYCFDICAIGDGAEYARQHVCIDVVTCVEGAGVRVTPETFNVSRHGKWVTGHITPPPGYHRGDVTGATIVSIGGIATSIVGERNGNGVFKFSSDEFGEVADDIVGPGDPREMDVPVCIVLTLADGMESCEACWPIDIIFKGAMLSD